jgi:ABC-type oligopeptide transport system ATPase subunit
MIQTEIILTNNQQEAVNNVKQFATSENDIFILTGAAGTGKTTVVKNIVEELSNITDGVVLLAPTNRAAKVLSTKTGILTNTVHSEIYKLQDVKDKQGKVISTKFIPRISSLFIDEEDGISLQNKNIIYIVDESSMLSDAAVKDADMISDNGLLSDLYSHVKYGTPKNKIIFVGDSYQLPPINYSGVAPALDVDYLTKNISENIEVFKLTKILRQAEDSEIITMAQEIKSNIDLGIDRINLKIPRFNDYFEFISNFSKVYDSNNSSVAIALGWSRKNVLQMNLDIRKSIYGSATRVFEIGDMLYLNSKWSNLKISIPKGEIGKVVDVVSDDGVKGGLQFNTLRIEFADIENKPFVVETKVLTDFVYNDIDFMSKQMFQQLAIERSRENKLFKITKEAKNDEYMSAMQVKFAYALTVHKAQGGEWKNVFLHAMTNWRDLRWNYTAITRASENIFSYWK